ncbi:LysR family transcriptional regulator [Sphingomonas sp.]|jgi:LysR family glycine cleavage system transcriptional activator|uniref:LysR family transcriptional regulator n=1 Tax=Sphingomonas sp. TaxID=28214 RepID=UPI002DEB8E58|nr:LysR family transcriptional regulator [Sphingomonas sp.]HEV2569363.1 LysR family transcriptional regulator [Sphingomonas sp.]
MKRTHLPLNGLRVLDAAARHLSFTRAADELAVTPAAVGQQIRALEDTLGTVLFRRTTRGLELTPEAEAGLDALRHGFLCFEDAVRAMQAGQSSKVLTIAAPRDLTARWLSSRLGDLAKQDPELRFHLIAADEAIDFTEANLDLAIRLMVDKGELEGVSVGSASFLKVASPSGEADRWIAWPGHAAPEPILRVADAGLAIEAAAAGLGRALVPELLARGDVEAGRLRILGDPVDQGLRYWLIAPTPQWRQAKVKRLVEHLSA